LRIHLIYFSGVDQERCFGSGQQLLKVVGDFEKRGMGHCANLDNIIESEVEDIAS